MISTEIVLSRLLVTGAVLTAYGVVIIAAGHGVGPVALLMIFGSPAAWLSGQILGWPGTLISLLAIFARSELFYESIRFGGTSLLVLSVCAFVSRSEAIVFSILTAIPLLGTWLFFLWRYIASKRASRGSLSTGRPRQVTWAVACLGIALAVQAIYLVPALTRESLMPLEVFLILQCLVSIVMTVCIWRGANWARWGIVGIIVANRIYFLQTFLETMKQFSVVAMVTGTWLLLDIAILSLLFTRPASLWLRGPHSPSVNGF